MNAHVDPGQFDHLHSSAIAAEQSLIGSCLLQPVAMSAAVGLIEPAHMLEPCHSAIWEAMIGLVGDGRAVTPQTVIARLGNPVVVNDLTLSRYLARCVSDTTYVVHAIPDACRQVREYWALRQVVARSEDARTYALMPGASPRAIISDLMQELDTSRAALEGQQGRIVTSGDVANACIDIMAARMQTDGQAPDAIPTGLRDLDNKLSGGFRPGNLVIVAGRPGMGKSLFAVSVSRQSARLGNACGFFSLEMLKEEIGARFIADQGYSSTDTVSASQIVSGRLSDHQADSMASAARDFGELPIELDPSSNLTVGELGARTRTMADRLTRKGQKLKAVYIDYLKFLRASERYRGQRHYEIGEISAGLKALAKDLGIAVVLLAQLNREVEKRPDKRPELSDLRECVNADTRLVDAATGQWRPIVDFRPGDMVLAVDVETQKIKPFAVEKVWKTGRKPVFQLTTRTGRRITATDNHPLLGPNGWKALGELKVGDEIATAMRLPAHGLDTGLSADLARLLGYMVGDGTYQKHRTVGFISSDPATFDDVAAIVVANFPGVSPRVKKKRGPWQDATFPCLYDNGHGKPFGNPLREWLRSIDVAGQRDSTKRVPTCCFETDEAAANFLAGYLSADGCVKHAKKGNRQDVWEIHFDSISRGLLEDVQALLMRFGIVASINGGYKSKKGTVPIYRLSLAASHHNLLRFAQVIPARGRKGELLAQLRLCEAPQNISGGSIFDLPTSVSKLLASLAPRKTIGSRNGPKVYEGWKYIGRRLSRLVCRRWSETIASADLSVWADSDLLWEEIVSIEPAGVEDVYDICVPGAANFLGNGIVAHNSGDLEADADTVMLLFREEYYLANEANPDPVRLEACHNQLEIIVAKQRMGSTGSVPVFCHVGASAIRNVARF